MVKRAFFLSCLHVCKSHSSYKNGSLNQEQHPSKVHTLWRRAIAVILLFYRALIPLCYGPLFTIKTEVWQMNNFHNELQSLNLGDFQATNAIPWDNSQYYDDQQRQIGLIFSCFSCFRCSNCFTCFTCFSCFNCFNCFSCGGRCGGNCGGRCGGGRCGGGRCGGGRCGGR
jgi:heterocycloanthracin/sonorensin family bacteriocin